MFIVILFVKKEENKEEEEEIRKVNVIIFYIKIFFSFKLVKIWGIVIFWF